MKKIILTVVASVIILGSCSKEGLSENTGNIEITLPGGPDFYVEYHYEIFTEAQYERYINALSYFALREGNSRKGKITETGILQGNYVIKAIPALSSGGFRKYFQIVANKVNKYTMP